MEGNNIDYKSENEHLRSVIKGLVQTITNLREERDRWLMLATDGETKQIGNGEQVSR